MHAVVMVVWMGLSQSQMAVVNDRHVEKLIRQTDNTTKQYSEQKRARSDWPSSLR